ncbi:MAG: glycosyltransferase family 4 protein [Siphonobacter sp.]
MTSSKILYIYQFFRTPEEGGIIRSYYLSKALVNAGHAVEVITSHNKLHYEKKNVEGITVHYLPLHYEQHYGTLRRLYVYFIFVLKAIRCALKIKHVERCYVASVPLSVGFIGLAMKWLRGVPYFFEVGDLWPLTPIEMGYFKNRWVQKLLYGLELTFYRYADIIVGLSPAIQINIQSRIAQPEKVYCIPNIADCGFFYPTIKDPALEQRWDVQGKFVITYFGSIGKVVQLESLINTAREGRSQNNIVFLVVGQGSELVRLQALASDLPNVRFLDQVNKKDLRNILNITDAVYLSYMPIPALSTNSPNKLFESLAAGKLSIINIRGWHCELIEQAGCGFYTDPEQPEQFYQKLKPYLVNPAQHLAASQKARALAERDFSLQKLSHDFVALFAEETLEKELLVAADKLSL